MLPRYTKTCKDLRISENNTNRRKQKAVPFSDCQLTKILGVSSLSREENLYFSTNWQFFVAGSQKEYIKKTHQGTTE